MVMNSNSQPEFTIKLFLIGLWLKAISWTQTRGENSDEHWQSHDWGIQLTNVDRILTSNGFLEACAVFGRLRQPQCDFTIPKQTRPAVHGGCVEQNAGAKTQVCGQTTVRLFSYMTFGITSGERSEEIKLRSLKRSCRTDSGLSGPTFMCVWEGSSAH